MAIKKFSELTLADDFIFGEIMRQSHLCKPFLEALLQKKIERVVSIDKQKDLKDNYGTHGIRLDVYLEDDEKTKYDVEMQTTTQRSLEKRIRFYQGGMDRYALDANEDYEDLRKSYVIFICTSDYFGKGLAVYERESRIKGAPEILYDDGSNAFILNANFTVGNATEDVLEFLRYIKAGKRGEPYDVSKSQYLSEIDDAIQVLKTDEGREKEYMTLAMKLHDVRYEGWQEGLEQGRSEGLEQGRSEGLQQGRSEGLEQGRSEGLQQGRSEGLEQGRSEGQRLAQVNMIKHMLSLNYSPEKISEITGYPLDEVNNIIAGL